VTLQKPGYEAAIGNGRVAPSDVPGEEAVMSDATAKSAVAESRMVPAPGGRLHVKDFPGAEPAVVVMHGFPDDLRIYDRLAPLLAPRRVVAVDWLGYGRSDRADPGPIDGAQHQRELRAVLDSLELGQVGLVGHDASGPDAIDFALGEPGRVGHLILLNTYYGHPPPGRFPEMIRLLADPGLTPLADAMMDDPNQRLWLLNHTGRRWGLDAGDQQGIAFASILPQFFGDDSQPDALAAVRAWTSALFPALDQQDARIAAGDLGGLGLPVTLIFGAADDYLSPRLARHLAGLFPHADLHLVNNASHWVQWDQPEIVARLINQAAPH
jgi:haloalkane dehalogenase